MYLIDESSSRHDGFINTDFFARAKNYRAFAEPSLGFQIQGVSGHNRLSLSLPFLNS